MSASSNSSAPPALEAVGIFVQPACLQHKYIRHANSSHIFERPERLRAVLLGVAAAAARLEEAEQGACDALARVYQVPTRGEDLGREHAGVNGPLDGVKNGQDDLASLLSSLNIASSARTATSSHLGPKHLHIVSPPPTRSPGQIMLHHPALQLAHSAPSEEAIPYLPRNTDGSTRRFGPSLPSSEYLRELLKWANEAPERIKATGCEIPPDKGLNQGDLYLGPGSVLAIEGAVQTVCQAVDHVLAAASTPPAAVASNGQVTPPATTSATSHPSTLDASAMPPSSSALSEGQSTGESSTAFRKAFCAIRPPGHHCGESSPSGFCYVNNVVVGAMHAYLEHDVDRAIIIDFDLHHGNGTQALLMPLNAATFAEELAVKAGKPPTHLKGKDGKTRRGWKGFYGSVHDIYSYPCEDGDLDLVKDASLSLAAHGQYIENVHLQPYSSTSDFYTRIYPLYSTLLRRAEQFLLSTSAPDGSEGGAGAHDSDRTILFISAGFDACEHEYDAMQRHDRRVPASFFERYTADIARFADKWCGGKVVSVLEGGYSDRALTSGSLGHVVGMASANWGVGRQAREAQKQAAGLSSKNGTPDATDRGEQAARVGGETEVLGREEWYAEQELVLLERAAKKKRTGKLHPIPADLSHLPHLSRTHGLLAQLESVGASSSGSLSSAEYASTSGSNGSMTPSHSAPSAMDAYGSAQTTPIAQGRMTLRARKPIDRDRGSESVEALVTPPRNAAAGGTGRGRGRGRAAGAGAGAGAGPGGRATTANTPKAETPSVKVERAERDAGNTTPVDRLGISRQLRLTPTPSPLRHLHADRDAYGEVSGTVYGRDSASAAGAGVTKVGAGPDVEFESGPQRAGNSDEGELDDLLGAMGSMAIRGSPARLLQPAASQQHTQSHPHSLVAPAAKPAQVTAPSSPDVTSASTFSAGDGEALLERERVSAQDWKPVVGRSVDMEENNTASTLAAPGGIANAGSVQTATTTTTMTTRIAVSGQSLGSDDYAVRGTTPPSSSRPTLPPSDSVPAFDRTATAPPEAQSTGPAKIFLKFTRPPASAPSSGDAPGR